MAQKIGKFVWYDVMTTDTAAAEAFYRSAIGWDMKDSGMPGPKYTLLSVGPTMVGGLMPIPEDARAMGARPGWMGYIGVDDVDAYAARVKAAGGAIHRAPQDIPGIGRFAVASDPQGAAFILFKGSTDAEPAPVAPGTSGHIGWHELHASDHESAYAFYSGMFGWTKGEAIDMGPMGVYQLFATGGDAAAGGAVGGMMNKMPDMPMPFWLYYFNVDGSMRPSRASRAPVGKLSTARMKFPGEAGSRNASIHKARCSRWSPPNADVSVKTPPESIRRQCKGPRLMTWPLLDAIPEKWSGREDSNFRPPAPHAGALPGCATPRLKRNSKARNYTV